MSDTQIRATGFTIRGCRYMLDGGPDVTRLYRLEAGKRAEVATFGTAWDPEVVLCVADIDAQAQGAKVAARILKSHVFGVIGLAVMLMLATPAWAVGRGPEVGPPTDKPGPQQPHDPPAIHDPDICDPTPGRCRR